MPIGFFKGVGEGGGEGGGEMGYGFLKCWAVLC